MVIKTESNYIKPIFRFVSIYNIRTKSCSIKRLLTFFVCEGRQAQPTGYKQNSSKWCNGAQKP